MIVVPVLIGTAVHRIDDGERSVLYSTVTEEIVGVYGPGLHIVQPGVGGSSFSRRVVVHAVPNVLCTTKDGIQVTMSVEAQYTYSNEEADLINVFRHIGDHDSVETLVDAITRNSILTGCGNLSAVEMYVNRANAELTINKMIRTAINMDPAEITGDNGPVRQISLPLKLQEQLKMKDTATERVEVAKRERPPILIGANISLDEAQFKRDADIQDARAEAERILYKADQDAKTVIGELQVLGENLAISAEKLGVTAAEMLSDVLETKQRGEEQSRSLQLCLADCKRTGSSFSCGLCYLADAGLSNNVIIQP